MLFTHITLLQSLGDTVTGQVCKRDIELVGDKAQKCLVEFLVECCVEVLLEEGLSKLETTEGHLCCLAVLCTHNISLSCGDLSEREPAYNGNHEKKNHKYPEDCRSYKEHSLHLELRRLDIDESDVASEILHILLHRRADNDSGVVHFLSTGHIKFYRSCLKSDVLFLVDVIIRVLYRFYNKVTVAARNERELIVLAARHTTLVDLFRHLGVIYLHIRWEIHLRSLEKGNVAVTCHCHKKRSRLVSLERVLAYRSRDLELSHSTCK